jgi:hypothetical protein
MNISRVGTPVPRRPRTVEDNRPYHVGHHLSQCKCKVLWRTRFSGVVLRSLVRRRTTAKEVERQTTEPEEGQRTRLGDAEDSVQ